MDDLLYRVIWIVSSCNSYVPGKWQLEQVKFDVQLWKIFLLCHAFSYLQGCIVRIMLKEGMDCRNSLKLTRSGGPNFSHPSPARLIEKTIRCCNSYLPAFKHRINDFDMAIASEY